MTTNTHKKSIHTLDLFPITIYQETYYVTYDGLKEFVERGIATEGEREIYDAVRCIFEPLA